MIVVGILKNKKARLERADGSDDEATDDEVSPDLAPTDSDEFIAAIPESARVAPKCHPVSYLYHLLTLRSW